MAMFGDSDEEDSRRDAIIAAVATARAAQNDLPVFAAMGKDSANTAKGKDNR